MMSEKYQETAPLATVFNLDNKVASSGEVLEAEFVLWLIEFRYHPVHCATDGMI